MALRKKGIRRMEAPFTPPPLYRPNPFFQLSDTSLGKLEEDRGLCDLFVTFSESVIQTKKLKITQQEFCNEIFSPCISPLSSNQASSSPCFFTAV